MLMFEISKYVCINSVFATVGASQQKLSKANRLVIVPYSQKHDHSLSLSLDFLSLKKKFERVWLGPTRLAKYIQFFL
jgi:hypothetical protein